MNHDQFSEKVSLWFDDQLSQAEIDEIRIHMAEEREAREQYQAMQQMDTMFQQAAEIMVAPEPGFAARFEARLARQQMRSPWHTWLGLISLSLGAMTVLIIGFYFVSGLMAWLDLDIVYHSLASLSLLIEQIRTYLDFGNLFLKVFYLTVTQPFFWGYILAMMILTGLWWKMIQMVSQKASVKINLLV